MPNFLFDHLEEHQSRIVSHWARNERVVAIFSVHNIDVAFFENHFAGRILEYLIKVSRGEERIGECPVLMVMLNFFKKHKIRLRELYTICMALRLVIVDEMFSKDLANRENYSTLVNIMDQNFEGVIEEYIALCYISNPVDGPIPQKEAFQNFPVADSINNAPSPSTDEEIEFIDFGTSEPVTGAGAPGPILSAMDFLGDQEPDTEDIMTLRDIEEEIKEQIRATDYTKDLLGDITQIADFFKKYGNTILYLEEFSKLSQSLMRMGDVFIDKDAKSINPDNIAIIPMMFEALVNDLTKWRIDIFIAKAAADIHFLDASIIASCEQCIAFLDLPSGDEDDSLIFL